MYCIKVTPGRERIRVIQVARGFNPQYREAKANGKVSNKQLVVTGYVFTMQYKPGATKVPDEEWKIIEAISDPHLSTVDQRTRKVIDGPLKAIEKNISVIQAKRVKVLAMILGEERSYWLAVDRPEGEALSEEGEAGTMTVDDKEATENEGSVGPKDVGEEKRKRKVVLIPRTKYDFTEEQKAAMKVRAEEIGIREAAKEFSVPWQAIAQLKRREREKNGEPPVHRAKRPDSGKKRIRAAEGVSVLSPMLEDAESLRIQNALLREQLAKLEAQKQKLQRAIRELL